jgi:uncharacterized membrane protein
MVCYAVPLAALILLNLFFPKKFNSLNLLLLGGAIMLIVDHLFNNELFLISENIFFDLLAGFSMTLAVIIFWFLFLKEKNQNLFITKRIFK